MVPKPTVIGPDVRIEIGEGEPEPAELAVVGPPSIFGTAGFVEIKPTELGVPEPRVFAIVDPAEIRLFDPIVGMAET